LDLLLARFSQDWIPRGDEIALNLPVLVATAAAALLTGFLFGLYPAWRAAKTDAVDAVRDGSKGSAGPESVRLRSVLVVSQIALTLVLLVCAGLVWKSFAAITRVNPGIEIENTLSMVVTLAPTRYETMPKRSAYYRQLLERVRGAPGVEQAAFTQTMPFTWGIPATFTVDGSADDQTKFPPAFYDSVTPSFFSTLHIPLLNGRTFVESDNAAALPVVVVSESAAKKFFPGENPIGRRLILPAAGRQTAAETLTVIGVVGDVPRNGLDAETPYQIYAPMEQRGTPFATLLVRSPMPLATLTKEVERAIWSFNAEQTIANVSPVRALVEQTLTQPQLYLTLFSLFAILGLFLGSVGLYALIAYNVARRTREFGIRFALGAQIRDVTRLVMAQGAKLTVLGLIIGLFCAAGVARLMTSLLFHTSAYDPVVFGGVILVLMVIGFAAALVPAWRATRVDPVVALRYE
jgi:predicted permease